MSSDSSSFDDIIIKYLKFSNLTILNVNNFPNWEGPGPCNKKCCDSLTLVYVFIVHYLPVAS